MKNKFGPAQFAANMFMKGILKISKEGFPIRGVKTMSPVFLDSMGMVQREMLKHIADAMTYDLPHQTEIVAGSRFGIIITSEIARLGGFKNLPIITDELGGISGLKAGSIEGENILLVTDIVATGIHTSEAVEMIERAGGICENIYTVFDYGFHLTPRGLRDKNIKSLLTLKQLAESRVATSQETEILQTWIIDHNSMFGGVNRKKVTGMASAV